MMVEELSEWKGRRQTEEIYFSSFKIRIMMMMIMMAMVPVSNTVMHQIKQPV